MGLRVLHISHTDQLGGGARAAYRIHREMLAQGIDSWMWVAHRTLDEARLLGPKTRGQKFWARLAPFLDRLLRKLLKTPSTVLHSPAWISCFDWEVIRDLKPDVIQLHWICRGTVKIEDFSRFDAPVIWRLSDMWAFCGAEHFSGQIDRFKNGYTQGNRELGERGFDLNAWTWRRKRKAYAATRSLTIVAPSRWLGEAARASALLKSNHVENIPTGVHPGIFAPFDKKLARKLLLLPQQGQLILFGAVSPTSDPIKGYRELVTALRVLRDRTQGELPGLVLFGANDAPEIRELGFTLHGLGHLHDDVSLKLAYAACDVFVAPSQRENLANTVLESMACGTPVVAFATTGMLDAIVHEQTGYLAKAYDSEDLAQGIAWALAAPASVRDAARARIEERFSLPRLVPQYLRLYRELTAAPQDEFRIVIQGRMGSERLPGKTLASIRGKPSLEHLIDALCTRFPKQSIIIASSQHEENEPISQLCARKGVACYRGDERNVASRFREIAVSHAPRWMVRLNADSPLLDPAIVAQALERARASEGVDLVTTVSDAPFPSGMNVEVIGTQSFLNSYTRFDKPEHFEHVTKYFYEHASGFTIDRMACPVPDARSYKFTIDTAEDLSRIRLLAERIASTDEFPMGLVEKCAVYKEIVT